MKNDLTKLIQYADILPQEKQVLARELVNEMIFMRKIIDDLQQEIRENGITELWQNGKQQNTRTTPAYKSYYEIINRQKQYINEYSNLFPKNQALSEEQTDELLDFIKE